MDVKAHFRHILVLAPALAIAALLVAGPLHAEDYGGFSFKPVSFADDPEGGESEGDPFVEDDAAADVVVSLEC